MRHVLLGRVDCITGVWQTVSSMKDVANESLLSDHFATLPPSRTHVYCALDVDTRDLYFSDDRRSYLTPKILETASVPAPPSPVEVVSVAKRPRLV